MMGSFESMYGRSELILEHQLDNARIDNRRRDNSKTRRARCVIWIPKIRSIGEIEQFRSCAEALRFTDGNRALKCQVEIPLSWAAHHTYAAITEVRIAGPGSKRRLGSRCKCQRVQVSAQDARISRSSRVRIRP